MIETRGLRKVYRTKKRRQVTRPFARSLR